MQKNLTKKNFSEKEMTEIIDLFIDGLVKAVLGKDLADIPQEFREEIVLKCLSFFEEYILTYFSQKFGKKYSLRLQASQKLTSIFEKFPDLTDKFQEACASFLEDLTKDSFLELAQQYIL